MFLKLSPAGRAEGAAFEHLAPLGTAETSAPTARKAGHPFGLESSGTIIGFLTIRTACCYGRFGPATFRCANCTSTRPLLNRI